jgi:surface polysaccharide O-acyltransferase-like enzyme
MQKTTNNRIYYINLLRAIAIFLVIINHGPTLRDGSVPDQLSLLFSEAAVPVFFMASGAVLLSKQAPDFKKYLRRLITVYAAMTVWRLIYLVLAVPAGYAGLANASAADVINYLFFFGSLDGIPAGHLWFMTAYLAIYSMLPLLHSLYGPDSGLDKPRAATGRHSHCSFWFFCMAFPSFR